MLAAIIGYVFELCKQAGSGAVVIATIHPAAECLSSVKIRKVHGDRENEVAEGARGRCSLLLHGLFDHFYTIGLWKVKS